MGSFRVFGIQVDGYRRKTGIVNIDSFQGESTYQTETDTPWPALERVPMVYICVSKIVNQILKLPRRVLNSKGEVVRSPTWIEDPNPLQSGDDMMSAAAISLLLEGVCYFLPIRQGANKVAMLGVGNPQQINHTLLGGRLEYRINGKVTDQEILQVNHLSLPGRIRGVRRVGPSHYPAAITPLAEISVEALRYTQTHLMRGGAYQLIISGSGRMLGTPEGRTGIRNMFKSQHAGSQNAYNELILPPGLEVTAIDPKSINADKGFIDLSKATDAAIAASFGIDAFEVNLAVAGSSRVYVNEPARQQKLYSNAIQPIVDRLEKALTTLLPAGQRFDFDESKILVGGPHDRAALITSIANAQSALKYEVLFPEEIRELAGYEGPPPVAKEPEPEPPPLPGGVEDEETPALPGVGDDDEEGDEEDEE